MCHAEGGSLPYPPDHAGRPLSTCLVCHATTQEESALPAPVKHDLEGREECLMCHAVDLLPESHKAGDFSNTDCVLCHTPGGAETEATEAGEGGDVSFANDVLPMLETNCATCHGEMAMGGLQATDYDSLMAGGQSGPVVLPGSPDESLIVVKMDGEHPAVLTSDDLQSLGDWIAAGAENN
jgi:mono/diheme cytochrome c family protein